MRDFKDLYHRLQRTIVRWRHGNKSSVPQLYIDDLGNQRLNGQFFPYQADIVKIVVSSDIAKNELLRVSRYLHDSELNPAFVLVNTLIHIHHNPDMIEVENRLVHHVHHNLPPPFEAANECYDSGK